MMPTSGILASTSASDCDENHLVRDRICDRALVNPCRRELAIFAQAGFLRQPQRFFIFPKRRAIVTRYDSTRVFVASPEGSESWSFYAIMMPRTR